MQTPNRADLRVFRRVLLAMVPSALLAGTTITTSMSISVDPTSISIGQSATVTATVTPNTSTINCGKGQIQYNLFYGATGFTTSSGWIQLDNNLTPVNNQFSTVFNTNLIPVNVGDKVSFRAGYASAGNGCLFENQAIGHSPTAALMIVAAAGPRPNNQTTGVY